VLSDKPGQRPTVPKNLRQQLENSIECPLIEQWLPDALWVFLLAENIKHAIASEVSFTCLVGGLQNPAGVLQHAPRVPSRYSAQRAGYPIRDELLSEFLNSIGRGLRAVPNPLSEELACLGFADGRKVYLLRVA